MAGEAKTGKFMLGTATVMIGAQADLFKLEKAQSVGLVKNVALKTTPAFTELSQGVKNSLVASVQTKNDMTVDGEMYEYTPANLLYAVSLDGTAAGAITAVETTIATAMALTGGLTGTTASVASATNIAVGDFIAIHVDGTDQIFVRKVTAKATNDLTINSGLPVAVAIGAKVRKVIMTPLGSTKDNPYLSCKIVGQLADQSWVTIYLPKVRVTSGLSLAFKTDNFDNIPFQLTVYDLVTTDPNYAFFLDVDGTAMKAQIFTTPAA